MNYHAQSQIDLYVFRNRPALIASDDLEILKYCNFNGDEAKEELRVWHERHSEDSFLYEGDPVKVKIYSSAFEDPEQDIIYNNFIKIRKRRFNHEQI